MLIKSEKHKKSFWFIARKNKLPEDDNGHGTHAAGIIAAIDNEIGVVGMLPDADLYSVKVLDSSGNGYISDVIEGIDWYIKNHIDILNMSLSMPNDSQALHDVIIQADKAGLTMVAAAGNNYSRTAEYPAAYHEVVSVGAKDQNGNIAPFSATDNVDFYAPGVDIYSTYMGGGYAEMDRTSMAVPHEISSIITINN